MGREVGQGTTEYVGILAVIALVVAAVLTGGIGMYVAMALEDSVALVTGGEPAAGEAAPEGQRIRAFGHNGPVLGAGDDCEITIVGGALVCVPPEVAPPQPECGTRAGTSPSCIAPELPPVGCGPGNVTASCVPEELPSPSACRTAGVLVEVSPSCPGPPPPPSRCGPATVNASCVPEDPPTTGECGTPAFPGGRIGQLSPTCADQGPAIVVNRDDPGARPWFDNRALRLEQWEQEWHEFNRRRPQLTPEQERAELERLRRLRLEAEPEYAQDAITSAPGSGIPIGEEDDTCVALCAQIVTGVPWRDFHEAFGRRVSSMEALVEELNARSEGDPWALYYHPEYQYADPRPLEPRPVNEALGDQVAGLTDNGPIVVAVRHPVGGLHSVVVERVGADLFRVQDVNFGTYEVTSDWFSRWAEIIVARP